MIRPVTLGTYLIAVSVALSPGKALAQGAVGRAARDAKELVRHRTLRSERLGPLWGNEHAY